MRITALHPGFIMPTKSTEFSAGIDLYMPVGGKADGDERLFGLGFAAAIPFGYVGLLLPRSGVGAKHGLELNNTCGVIDADYRKEWMASLRTKSGNPYRWDAGARVLQCVIVPVFSVSLDLVESIHDLGTTERIGGYGSSGT